MIEAILALQLAAVAPTCWSVEGDPTGIEVRCSDGTIRRIEQVQPELVLSPTLQERVDVGLLIGGQSLASIALGLTMACTATSDCRELNPVMRKLIGDGPTKAVVFKAAINGGSAWAVWHFTRGKRRTIVLGLLLAINSVDAVHDVRQMRKIQRRKAGEL